MPSITDVYAEVSPTLTPEGERRFTRALSRIDTSRAGVSIGQSLGKGMRVSMFKSAKGLAGPLAAVFAGIKVGQLFKGFIAEARESAKISRITAQAIKTTGGAAKISAKQVGALADAISNKTGVDDEAIQSGANLLLTFKKVRNEVGKGNDIFNRATAAALDLSKAGFGDLSGASKQLGKALNDPIKGIAALSRAGVTFTQQQKDQIKTLVESGRILDAQKIILAEVESQVGGAAAAAADPMERLRVIAGNLGERIGGFLVPWLNKAANWLGRVLPVALDKAIGFVGDFAAAVRTGLTGKVPTTGGVFHYVSLLSERIAALVTWTRDTAVPGIVAAFTDVKGRIESALPDIDLSGIAKTFTAQAKTWGSALIAGVKQGLDTGDWSGLGETVGKGLVAAIGAAAGFAKRVADKIGELFGKVDWIGLGITVGKQAIPFLAGLVIGILNVDLLGLLKGLAAHWQEAFIAVIALALAPAKFVGAFGRILARIPIVGVFLERALLWCKGLADGLVRGVGRALGFMGKAFLDGFRTVFPGIGKAFAEWIGLLPTRIGLAAIAVRARAAAMMRGLGQAIRDGAAWVLRNIGQLIAQMLRPWVNAARWLVNVGRNFVAGLVGGIRSYLSLAGSAVGQVISRVTAPFRVAGRWLLSAGRDLIGGLFAGIRAAMSRVGDILGSVKDAIVGGLKRLFGISSPSTVMAGIGGHMITGLIKGLLTNSGALAKVVKSIGGNIAGIFGGIDLGLGQSRASGAMQQMVAGYASMLYGWNGAQWTALRNLIMGESGFNPNAQNPTSTAYGLFQFLDSTWAGVNASKTSNPQGQTLAGLRYIKQRYGDPMSAYGAWLSRSPHWYDQGGGLPPGLTLAMNATGRTETVTPGSTMDAVVAELRALRRAVTEQAVVVNLDGRPVARAVRNQNTRNSNGWG